MCVCVCARSPSFPSRKAKLKKHQPFLVDVCVCGNILTYILECWFLDTGFHCFLAWFDLTRRICSSPSPDLESFVGLEK